MFISFDGIDGAGKTTQIELFAHWLADQQHEVVVFRDPGGTQLGEKVRDILLSKTEMSIDVRTEMMLYMASRTQLVAEKILPALQSNKMVITDRYVLATIAYQGHAGEIPIDEIKSVAHVATGGIQPDLIFLLDIDPGRAASRRQREPDRMEQRGIAYLNQVRQGFLQEAELHRSLIHKIDGHQSIDQVQAKVRSVAKSFMEKGLEGN